MKKTVLILTIILSLVWINKSTANAVDQATAQAVAKNYFHHFGKKDVVNLSLVYTEKDQSETPIYFVFNVNQNDGFVIVTAEDAANPVLGYSLSGKYSTNNLPPNFMNWMEGYKKQITSIRMNTMQATSEIVKNWHDYTNNIFSNAKSIASVNPLLSTTWDQGNETAGGYYNTLCPHDNSLPDANNLSTHCLTGCPATAMAQIMKYWSFPATGSGIHSYNHPSYGTLTANFGSTTYNWANMPNNVTSTNNDVATIMYQCGVSVEMNYGPDGSGGWVIAADASLHPSNPSACSQNAYVTYFGYDGTTIQGLKRINYTDPNWITLLENELDNSRPIQYAGWGTGGHTFVCDGYDNNNFFHMNWGWSGQFNGFFDLNALNPNTDNFSSGQEALIGIKPITGGNPQDIQLYSTITVTPNPINFDQSFTVNADVYNAGTINFNGDYCAALFDLAGNFINYVQILSTNSNPLPPGYDYTGGLTFSNVGMLAVPGTYIVGIYYRPTGDNWYLAGTTYFTNPINVTIAAPSNPLELYSNITPSPTTFIQGQAASVNVNILNNNSYTYTGEYQADLYDLSGNWVETIGLYDETTGLPSGYDYLTPFITFSTASVTASPGTYILAIIEQENFTGPWYYVGGDFYTNPVLIDVVAPALLPDIYEVNNTQATAYVFPLSWSSNVAYVNTTGSNIHIGSDIDFYKINLASGYNYVITARADDSYSSDTNVVYTVDVVWSYNSGSGWSPSYDDVMPGTINVNGNGSVVFEVSPYFTGEIGTYLLKMRITRTSTVGIEEFTNSTNLFEIYPNPASNNLNIKLVDYTSIQKLKLLNLMGQTITETIPTQSLIHFDLSGMANGMYFIEAVENGMTYSTKFVINR